MNQALDHARVDFDARNAACLTSLQDGIETLLLIVAEKVNAELPKHPAFDKYFQAINEKISPASLPSHSALMRLNKMRVSAKHAGIFPTHHQTLDLIPIVTEFMIEVCDSHLGVNWHVSNLSSLVEDERQRAFLQEAEAALVGKQYQEAMFAARKAFYLAFERSYDIVAFDEDKTHNILAKVLCEAPAWAKSRDYILSNVGDPFGYIVFDHAALDAKLVKLGIDPVAFWNVWRITPDVYLFNDDRWIMKHEFSKVEQPDKEGDAVYVVENVTTFILRKEEKGRMQKSVFPLNKWELTAKPGARIFSKASEASYVNHTCQGGETLLVYASTYDFDGQPGWWNILMKIPGQHLGNGYIREEDVVRD